MADDWQPGDLALCVRAGKIISKDWLCRGDGLVRGRLYTVVRFGIDPEDGLPTLWLLGDQDEGRLASRFRKVRPHQLDAEDAETIRLLNGKPVTVPA